MFMLLLIFISYLNISLCGGPYHWNDVSLPSKNCRLHYQILEPTISIVAKGQPETHEMK
jgi:hypothetical protein